MSVTPYRLFRLANLDNVCKTVILALITGSVKTWGVSICSDVLLKFERSSPLGLRVLAKLLSLEVFSLSALVLAHRGHTCHFLQFQKYDKTLGFL
jgi:hypothetical protein